MNVPARTKVFRSGNSGAVRLPKDLAFPIGTEVEIIREAGELKIRPTAVTISGQGWMGMMPGLQPLSPAARVFEETDRPWSGLEHDTRDRER